MGFKSSIADPDVCMIPATKPTGEKYYEYILCYIDNLICMSHNPRRPINDIQSMLKFKNDKVEEPNFYPGAKLSRKELNEKQVWTMSSTEYIKSSDENIEEQLQKRGKRIPAKAVTLMAQEYHPDLDATNELDQDEITTFQ